MYYYTDTNARRHTKQAYSILILSSLLSLSNPPFHLHSKLKKNTQTQTPHLRRYQLRPFRTPFSLQEPLFHGRRGRPNSPFHES
jgi:hypothetical protein